MIHETCPGCSASITVPDELAGRRVRCTTCGHAIWVDDGGVDEILRDRRRRAAWRTPAVVGAVLAAVVLPSTLITIVALTRIRSASRDVAAATARTVADVRTAKPAEPPSRTPGGIRTIPNVAGDRHTVPIRLADPNPPDDGPKLLPDPPKAPPKMAVQPPGRPAAKLPDPVVPKAPPKVADEPSPQTVAVIAKAATDLKSKAPQVRAAAYQSIGNLGPKAKGELRGLCEGLLDPSPVVREAAADALGKVDEKTHQLALSLLINKDLHNVCRSVFGRDAPKTGWEEPFTKPDEFDPSPLVPLVYKVIEVRASAIANNGDVREATDDVGRGIEFLLAVDPADARASQMVVNMLSNPTLRGKGGTLLPRLTPIHRRAALPAVLKILAELQAKGDTFNADAWLELVPGLVGPDTVAGARQAVASFRFDQQPRVREAAAKVLKELN